MLDILNLYLEVEEHFVEPTNKGGKTMYLPINSEIENLKVSDIPSYLGMQNAYVRVAYNRSRNSSISSAFANCLMTGEKTVAEFVLFCLLEAIENNSSMKRNVPNMDPDLAQLLENNEQLAIKKLEQIIDSSKLEVVLEKVRSFISSIPINSLIEEMELIPKNNSNSLK